MIWESLLGEDRFAQGVTSYSDQYSDDRHARIVLPIIVEFLVPTWAIVDTGAPWCIFNPAELEPLQATPLEEAQLRVRGIRYHGFLHRLNIVLEPRVGYRIGVDATAFIPQLRPGDDWPHPNFRGLQGFLDRIRFAVDPAANNFYFGG